jgi:PAS domain S-box-containing protein
VKAWDEAAFDWITSRRERLGADEKIETMTNKESHLNEYRWTEQLALKDRALSAAAEGITISDARLPDNPLIYANSGFEQLTGYSIASIIGKNCRFLQGRGTNPAAAEEIRRALLEQRACVVEILNYRQDGTPFWNGCRSRRSGIPMIG